MRWETLTTNEVAALDRDIPVVICEFTNSGS